MEYKIYNYIENVMPEDMESSPSNINYDIIGLHKKRTFNKGELTNVEYFGEYDLITRQYSDLVLTESRVYSRDNKGFAYKRDLTTVWYKNDDSVGDSKTTQKYYSADESIKEGETRRSNIISRLKLEAFSLLGDVNAYDFLTEIFTDLGLYRDGFKTSLLIKIQNLNKAYLDTLMADNTTTVRAYVIEELTFK